MLKGVSGALDDAQKVPIMALGTPYKVLVLVPVHVPVLGTHLERI